MHTRGWGREKAVQDMKKYLKNWGQENNSLEILKMIAREMLKGQILEVIEATPSWLVFLH